MTQFQNKVWQLTKKIPKGKVNTYKILAKALDQPQAARAVGRALNKNNNPQIPCHRVIKSDGNLGGYRNGPKRKKELLLKEGIEIKKGKVNLEKYLHPKS